MPETIIESVLSGKLPLDIVLKWLNTEPDEETPEDCELFCCSRSEFVAYFIAYLRIQTDGILKPKTSVNQNQTPEKNLPPRSHKRSTSEPTTNQDTETPLKTEGHRSHESPNRDKTQSYFVKKPGRRVKTKLFMNESKEFTNKTYSSPKTESDDSKLSSNSLEISAVSSTPLKNGVKVTDYPNLNVTSPVTPQGSGRQSFSYERCDTPRIGHRYKNQDKSISLGDYIANAHVAKTSLSQKKKRQSKNITNESDEKSIDLSNSEMFPEIGAKKSMDKRRIKPTNIDRTPQKSFTMNSFNADNFQQPSPMVLEDNLAFRHQKMQPKELAKSFDVERSILKQERHKLMEKFNILNVSSSPKPSTSQLRITQKMTIDKEQKYVKADVNRVLCKNEIDTLTDIYNLMINNNLLLSVGCEIYFLISILHSKQSEDDYVQIEKLLTDQENNLTNEQKALANEEKVLTKEEKVLTQEEKVLTKEEKVLTQEEKVLTKETNAKKTISIDKFILKSIHNSVYFAVKSLWHLRHILEMIFDKNTLKLLGENKDIRSFLPDLAKFLLNAYGLKCEQDNAMLQNTGEKGTTILESRSANGMVCFNVETDNVENFPSVLSFQNFRKQRDMFYEILRWYNETQQTGSAKSTFRTRVKTILSVCVSAANYAHLARLYVAHMLAECLPNRREESKLSKLQRRLTGATQESYRLPFFTDKELFYKEFLLFAEHEAFRTHLRDCLSSEICVLDSTALTNIDESTPDIAKEYMHTAKKLQLLSKFLGYLTDLSYTQVPVDYNLKTGQCDYSQREISYGVPKEKVLLNEIALRNYNQPTINLKGILTDATEKERLCISLPWITQYLATLHYTTLRIIYYRELLNMLFEIYIERLKENSKITIKKSIKIFLKFNLGWLFDLPQFPQELFYEKKLNKMATGSDILTDNSVVLSLDSVLSIDESMILELCPFLKDISCLLSSNRPIVDNKDCSYRHITPLSLTLNSDEKIRNKEKEIQLRLEEALIKSCPASTRRVLELVIERVSASTLRALSALLRETRDSSTHVYPYTLSTTELHAALTQLYTAQLESLKKEGLAVAHKRIAGAVKGALGALLTLTPKQAQPLEAIAVRHCKDNVAKWIHNNWTGIEILCKDINEEIRNIKTLGSNYTQSDRNKVGTDASALLLADGDLFEKANVPPSCVIIEIKEYICVLLDNEQPTVDIFKLLSNCLSACSPTNVFTLPGLHCVLCQLVCDLCVVMASRNPKQINESFLNKIYEIFDLCCPDKHKRDAKQKSLDISSDLNKTTDISAIRKELADISIDSCVIDRDFDNDDRMPTPISDDDENSSKTVMDYDAKKVRSNDANKVRSNDANDVVMVKNDTSEINRPESTKSTLTNYVEMTNLDKNDENFKVKNVSKTIDDSIEVFTALSGQPSTSKCVVENLDGIKSDSNSKVIDLDADISNLHCKKLDKVTIHLKQSVLDERIKIGVDTKKSDFDTNKSDFDTKKSDFDTKKSESETSKSESTKMEDSETILDYFNRILCSRNIVILSKSPCKSRDVWEAMAELLIFLLKHGFLNEESLTEQCLAVYRHDWPQNVLENLSTCMKIVSTKWRTRLGGKFNLFLDFLSEFCNTMDLDSFEIN